MKENADTHAEQDTRTDNSERPQRLRKRDRLKDAVRTGVERPSLIEAFRRVFSPELDESATRQQKWEKAVEGPLLFVSVFFLIFFTWASLGNSSATSTQFANWGIWVTWAAFSVDYIVRLCLAEKRWTWFWKHWWELALVTLPWFRPLQILRLIPVLVLMQRFSASSRRVTVASYTAGATILLVLVAALSIYDAEYGHPESQIRSFWDALWWSIVTITTVGYGDIAPVTAFGRVVGICLMIGGIAVAGVVTATVAAWLVEQVEDETEGEREQDHDETQESLEALHSQVRVLTQEIALLRAEISEKGDGQSQSAGEHSSRR